MGRVSLNINKLKFAGKSPIFCQVLVGYHAQESKSSVLLLVLLVLQSFIALMIYAVSKIRLMNRIHSKINSIETFAVASSQSKSFLLHIYIIFCTHWLITLVVVIE